MLKWHKSPMRETYRLLDTGNFEKLEQVGPFRVVRPAATASWRPRLGPNDWKDVDAVLVRKSGGEGEWHIKNPKMKNPWTIDLMGLNIELKLTSFGHVGIFPEQLENWQKLEETAQQMVKTSNKKPKVLNLFGYTGMSTLICARAGAEVVHVDASKTSVAWARQNAKHSGLETAPIRWLVEDAQEFMAREVRRGNGYDGIILDPPTYGRGSKNQMWKIEKHLLPLLDDAAKLLWKENSGTKFVLLTSHSPGYTPLALENILSDTTFGQKKNIQYFSSEMTIIDSSHRKLPSGTSSFAIS